MGTKNENDFTLEISMTQQGSLIVSLDFELNWGVHDVFSIKEYGENLRGVRLAIPEILNLFQTYKIHATWGVVGLLCFENKEQLLANLPDIKPSYNQASFSPYGKLDMVGDSEDNDPLHYGASLVRRIARTPHQEIGTHTFSHYYCLEEGQTPEQFEEDLKASIKILNQHGFDTLSFIFPRNQTQNSYLEICKRYGVMSYRGNEKNWIYEASNFKSQHPVKRVVRILDNYVNVTGHHTFKFNEIDKDPIINLPSSRFLRPYNKKLKGIEPYRLERIKKSLTHAAKKGEVYHLWWHPHNFGVNIEENLVFLRKILEHVEILKKQYKFESLNMKEAVEKMKLINL